MRLPSEQVRASHFCLFHQPLAGLSPYASSQHSSTPCAMQAPRTSPLNPRKSLQLPPPHHSVQPHGPATTSCLFKARLLIVLQALPSPPPHRRTQAERTSHPIMACSVQPPVQGTWPVIPHPIIAHPRQPPPNHSVQSPSRHMTACLSASPAVATTSLHTSPITPATPSWRTTPATPTWSPLVRNHQLKARGCISFWCCHHPDTVHALPTSLLLYL
jgi:hypothetical protein